MHETMERAEALLQQTHVSADAKQVIKDLVSLVHQLEAIKSENTGISADKRYKEAKLAEERAEKKRIEKTLEQLKAMISGQLPTVIKEMSAESQMIITQGQTLHNETLVQSGEKLKAQLRNLVAVIASVGKV